ncbi:MAG: hypothetical protein HQK54_13095 [Oligoflexales bacterium]|nr:hypothetical protein [Oligoflexales bacterium]
MYLKKSIPVLCILTLAGCGDTKKGSNETVTSTPARPSSVQNPESLRGTKEVPKYVIVVEDSLGNVVSSRATNEKPDTRDVEALIKKELALKSTLITVKKDDTATDSSSDSWWGWGGWGRGWGWGWGWGGRGYYPYYNHYGYGYGYPNYWGGYWGGWGYRWHW